MTWRKYGERDGWTKLVHFLLGRLGMSLADDGDLIRGVGYVAIYSAYLEEIVDDLLFALDCLGEKEDDFARRQPSSKLKEIKRRLEELGDSDFEELVDDLSVCDTLLSARHAVLHDRIYAQISGPAMYHPARPERSKRPASSIELYELANQMQTCRARLMRPLVFAIPSAISRRSSLKRE